MDDLTEGLENDVFTDGNNDGNKGRTETDDTNKASDKTDDPKRSEVKAKSSNGLFGLLRRVIINCFDDAVVVTTLLGLGSIVYYGIAKVFHLEETAMDVKKRAFRDFWESIKDRDEYN